MGRQSRGRVRVRQAGRASWSTTLDAGVVRVGSHPSCGLRLDGLAPHVLTIERRGGVVTIHNRDGSPITLGDIAVLPGTAATWRPGERLSLGDGLELELDQESGAGGIDLPALVTPTPGQPRGSSSMGEEGDVDPSPTGPLESPAEGRGSSPGAWAAVVPLTLIAVAFWVAGQSLGSSGPAPETGPDATGGAPADELDELVASLLRQGELGRRVAHQVQLAAQEEARGRFAESEARRQYLRDFLLRERPRDGAFAPRDEALELALKHVTTDPG